jgi:transposase
MLDPYKAFIAQTLAQHPKLRATRLYEMIRPRGYTGSAMQVRRYVAAHRPVAAAEAYLRLTTMPGEQAQVDWAHFGRIQIGRATRSLSCFVMVLSWSRAVYARFVLDQQLETFLRCHTRAFEAFGGVPRVLLYDNLKSVVLERVGDHIRYHPRLHECSAHYHFAPKPCAPYRGNEKGKVERTIQFLRHSFFDARAYTSLDDLNAQLARWIEEIAHARQVPGDDTTTVREAFDKERSFLLQRPEHDFPCDVVSTISSGKTPYIRFDLNDYSIPHTLVRKPLTLVANNDTVRLVDGTVEVARHTRSWSRNETIELPEHVAALARAKRRSHELRGRDRLRDACKSADPFIAALIARDFHLGSQTARLIKLLDRHGAERLETALAEALARGAVNAAAVTHLIDRNLRHASIPPPLDAVLPDDPRVRDAHFQPHSLADYDALLRKEKP